MLSLVVLADDRQEAISLGFNINGVIVFDEGLAETWSSSMLNQRILKKFGDELIDSVEIIKLRASTKVANEFLDAIIQRDTP